MMKRSRTILALSISLLACSIFAVSLLGNPRLAHAATAAELQAQINARNEQIKALQTDIAAYQKQIDELGTKQSTLKSTISSLSLSQKQLNAQIQVTQAKISSANLQIQELTLSIGDKTATVAANQSAIASALKTVSQNDTLPLIARLVSSDSLTNMWKTVDENAQFNRALARDINALQAASASLAETREQTSAEKAKLVTLQNELTTQKRSVDANKAAQQKLLTDTKNQESNYQKMLAQKKAAEQAFEDELNSLQSQLDLIVHPGSLPKVGSGVLSWPFTTAFMKNCSARKSVFDNLFCITQYFGTTPFSTANPQVYNGHGHNGVDFAAPIGTPIAAAGSGTVLDTGNTDAVRGCYSFGKWVMIEHGNGINTLYAHLSSIDVSKGQHVTTGQIIGLSGMTGFATGPHLHFGVYATEGTKIMTLRQFRGSTIGCADAKMPVATLTAYLNPLSYL